MGINLSDHQETQLRWLYEHLLEVNRHTNLTRITALDDFLYRHLLDSLTLAPSLPTEAKVADIGSGAGFPALPLAIARPDIQVIARVTLPNGTREIPFADFPLGLMSPAIEANELVVSVRFPLWKRGHGFAFEEFARRHGDFAVASAAVLLEMEHGRVERGSVVVGGLDSRPQRPKVGLHGRQSSTALFDEVAAACDGLEAMSDSHVDAGYRKRVARAMVRRALERARGRVATD